MSAPGPHTVSAAALRPFRAAQARLAHPLAALELTCAQADGIVALLAFDLAPFDARPLGALPARAPVAPGAMAGGLESRPGRRRWGERESRAPGARPGRGGARAAAVERAWRGDLGDAFTVPSLGEGARLAAGGEGSRLADHDRAESARRAVDDPAARAGTRRAAFGAPSGAEAGAHDFAAPGAAGGAARAATAPPGASGPADLATLAAAAEAALAAGRAARAQESASPAGRAAPRALTGRERVAAAIGSTSDAAMAAPGTPGALGGDRPAGADRAALGPPPAALLADLAGAALVRPAAPATPAEGAPPPAQPARPPALAAPAAARANGASAAPAPPAALSPAEHAWLVNEALVEQARRHGVDLS